MFVQFLAKPSGSVSIQVHSQPASASNFRLTQTSGNRVTLNPRRAPLSDDDFPSLGPAAKDDHPSIGAAGPQPAKVFLINRNGFHDCYTIGFFNWNS